MTNEQRLPPGDAGWLARVLGHLRRNLHLLSDDMRPTGPGWIVRTDSLPLVWTLNQLRITGAAAFEDVAALAEENQAYLPYRHVVFEDGAAGGRLESRFANGGWGSECEVIMTLEEASDRKADTGAVIELSEEQMLALMRRWSAEEHAGVGVELDELDEYNRREGRLWNERRFGVLDERGAPVAITKLRTDGSTAWVEDVYTVPEARGRGYARGLVTHAVTLARSGDYDLTFIIADDNDWPKHLYEAIGFRPIGTTRTFHRTALID
jgi:GNAT superfamily N-acetyltransferase